MKINKSSYNKEPINILKKKLLKKNKLIDKLRKLIEINSIITSSLERDSVLQNILYLTKELMECERISLLLVSNDKEYLQFAIITQEDEKDDLSSVFLKKGEGIAGTVWEHGKSILIKNATKDIRISRKADTATEFETRSLIAVPLVVNGEIIGVIEAINPTKLKHFSKSDVEILEFLSIQAAISIYNTNLYYLAITDGMTGLFIHRFFQQRLEEEFVRASRHNRELSLIMFDIDHFKNFNDTYGHQSGDEVIKAVSKIIKKGCRSSDVPCRYGGEEISVILPETGLDGAYKFAEKIRENIESFRLNSIDGTALKITISGGISSLTPEVKSKQDLIQKADEALYFSKRNGRNKISIINCEQETDVK